MRATSRDERVQRADGHVAGATVDVAAASMRVSSMLPVYCGLGTSFVVFVGDASGVRPG